jgi:hypothetical protein
MDMRFGICNIRSLCRSGSLKIVSIELSKYKLDLVVVQEARWDKGGTESAENFTFVHSGAISVVKNVEFVNDRMSYLIL